MLIHLRYIVRILGIAAICCGVASILLSKLIRIPTDSMAPTYQVGENVLFVRMGAITEKDRGRVVLFESSATHAATQNILMIKRLVGFPGDIIQSDGSMIRVNGVPVSTQPGVVYPPPRVSFKVPVAVPPRHYFVVGDNYSNSYDSRHFGFVSAKAITHSALFHQKPPTIYAESGPRD